MITEFVIGAVAYLIVGLTAWAAGRIISDDWE